MNTVVIPILPQDFTAPSGHYILRHSTGAWRIVHRVNGRLSVEALHRYLYKMYVGAIPENYVVHHVDGDLDNNLLSNLQLMTQAEHGRFHRQNPGLGDPKYSTYYWSRKPQIQAEQRRKYERRKARQHTAIAGTSQALAA